MDIVAIREAGQPDLQPLVEADQIAQTQRASLSARIDALTNTINALQQPTAPDLTDYAKLTDLTPYASKAELLNLDNLYGTIDTRFNSYDTLLANMEDILEELQLANEDEDEEVIVTDNEVRWYSEIYCTNYSEDRIEIDPNEVRISPSPVEEADDYTLYIPLLNHFRDTNTTPQPTSDVIISIVFTPKTGSRVIVDEGEIYLDSTYSPFIPWTADIVERTDGTCRRIRFTSEKIKVPAGTVVGEDFEPGELTLRLEFTLAYK